MEYVDAIDFEISCTGDEAILYWESKSPFHDMLEHISIEVICYNLTTNVPVSSWCNNKIYSLFFPQLDEPREVITGSDNFNSYENVTEHMVFASDVMCNITGCVADENSHYSPIMDFVTCGPFESTPSSSKIHLPGIHIYSCIYKTCNWQKDQY